MHEQTGNKIVEKLTIERSMEILGDKMKMDIFKLLERDGPSSFGDIIREFGMSQPTGTNHILELELLGLIEKRIDPPNYNINDDRYSVLLKYKKD
jgi:DNA-binding HxlR family transcriptional regulator